MLSIDNIQKKFLNFNTADYDKDYSRLEVKKEKTGAKEYIYLLKVNPEKQDEFTDLINFDSTEDWLLEMYSAIIKWEEIKEQVTDLFSAFKSYLEDYDYVKD